MRNIPPVISDVASLGLVSSLVATTIECNIPRFGFSFILVFVATLVSVGFGLYKNLIYSIFSYQLEAFFLLCLPVAFFSKKPTNILVKMADVGSFSYALYVIHLPIRSFVNRQVSLDKPLTMIYFLLASLVIIILSLSGAWFLECYLHPKIAKKLKAKFGLS